VGTALRAVWYTVSNGTENVIDLVFASNRPATDAGAALDGNYGGAVQPGRGGNLWRVDRMACGASRHRWGLA
jgi:hypothetical protein